MQAIEIEGGHPLRGRLRAAGSKNAALPILISALLSEDQSEFHHVPQLDDIDTTLGLLGDMGAEIERNAHGVKIRAAGSIATSAPYDWVVRMRASVLVLGPLLARFGKARVSLPGGCAIGSRPVNFHLTALEKMGAKIAIEGGDIVAHTDGLKGTSVSFEFPSVGATENILMAAVLAKGETRIKNAAKEPEIVDLARSLRSMGAQIEGEGSEEIRVQGVEQLKGASHTVMGDRIEAGTFLAAALVTRGDVCVEGIEPMVLESVLSKFEEAGATIERDEAGRSIHARWAGLPHAKGLRAVDMTTAPYPGFPTDMQAQWIALMSLAAGTCVVTETIFENRFMHVPELNRLGADVTVRGNTAIVKGVANLKGASVEATDLRASACLVIAGLAAQGKTLIRNIHHLDRGYENLEARLQSLGASIRRVDTPSLG